MKKNLLFFFLFIFFSKAYSVEIDSVLFSTDGKYVLIREGDDLNDCIINWWGLYQTGSNEMLYYVAINSDSAFVLTYDDTTSRAYFRREHCFTNATLVNKYLLNDFLNNYKLTLKSYLKTNELETRCDTLKSYKKAEENMFGISDSSLFFDIQVALYKSGQLVFSDTVCTDEINFYDLLNKDDHTSYHSELINIANYRLYYSENNLFYFVYGIHFYTQSFSTGGQIYERGYIECPNRHLGKNDSQ